MKIASVVMFVVALLCVSQVGAAAEKKTVYAVAKVDGRTKKIDGKVYHLVAMRLDPSVLLLNTGLGSSVLLVQRQSRQSGWRMGIRIGDRDTASSCCGCTRTSREVIWGRLADRGKDAGLRPTHQGWVRAFTVDVKNSHK